VRHNAVEDLTEPFALLLPVEPHLANRLGAEDRQRDEAEDAANQAELVVQGGHAAPFCMKASCAVSLAFKAPSIKSRTHTAIGLESARAAERMASRMALVTGTQRIVRPFGFRPVPAWGFFCSMPYVMHTAYDLVNTYFAVFRTFP